MKKKLMIIIIAFCCQATPVYAQKTNPNPDDREQTITYKWEKKKDHYRLKGSDGSLCKGLTTIKNKTYDFDSQAIQHTGWQKIEGHYYYFTIANKEQGCMVKNRTINAIRLDKNGRAVVNGYAKKKLKALTYATKLVEQATVPTKSKNK